MSESELQREIMIAVTKAGGRVFRNNVALAWVGQHQHGDGVVILRHARVLHAGLCVGSSDLIGYYRGRFLAIECKSPKGRATQEQKNFIDQVNAAGGIGIIARSVAEVLEALREAV